MQNRLKNKKLGGTATANDVCSGMTFINDSGNVITGTLPDIAKNYTISNLSELPLYLDKGYYGYFAPSADVNKIKITNVDNLIAENIKKGVTIFGIQGTYDVDLTDTLPDYVGYCVSNPSASGTSYTFPAGYPSPTSAYRMFKDTSNISSINLSNLDLSKVTNMSYMFYNSGITGIPNGLSKAVKNTSFRSLFYNCSSLASGSMISINCTATLNFDNVSIMDYMFSRVPAKVIGFTGVSNSTYWSKVSSMSGLFSNCSKLQGIICNTTVTFDTSNVLDMSCIFMNCTSLTEIPSTFSVWSKKSVTNLYEAFCQDTSLKTVDFDLSEATGLINFGSAFCACTALTSCRIQASLDSGTVHDTTKIDSLLASCNQLVTADLSKFYFYPKTQSQMSSMFYNCSAMTSCNISGINFSQVMTSAYTSTNNLFSGVKNCTIIVKDTATKTWFDAGKTAGYIDSTNTFVALPVSGDLITMDLGTTAASGTNNLYRVLSIDGNIAKVVAMYDYDTSTVFNSSSSLVTFSNGLTGQKYEGSNLDTVLNTTFYSAMNDTAKAAIISQTIAQTTALRATTAPTSYDLSAVDTSGTTYYYTVGGSVSVGERYVYALDISDLAEYKKDFGKYEVVQMFYNQDTASPSPWLRSTSTGYSAYVWTINTTSGYVSDRKYNTYYAVHPAFVIDLAKVSWSYNS